MALSSQMCFAKMFSNLDRAMSLYASERTRNWDATTLSCTCEWDRRLAVLHTARNFAEISQSIRSR
eukprot:3608902-Pleurochrysis_carterae.AAC.4